MLHVRVATSVGQTAGLVSLLAADPGVANLVVLPGAAREPDGDAVQFDLSNRAANQVLRQLRSRPAGALGPIAVLSVDAVLPAGAPGPEPAPSPSPTSSSGSRRWATYHGETAPVWDVIEAKITAESVYAPSFYVLLALAGMIGAVGILTNSTILIVGAMVVGPEYNAIIAVALGLERRDPVAVRRGLLALVIGFLLAIAVTLAFSAVIRVTGHTPSAYLAGVRPVSNLIESPDLFSVVVAVLAGIVGVVSLTEARASAMIGVFISVTTIPAAADIGLCLAFRNWQGAGAATLQLLLNVTLLILVGALALRGQRLFWRDRA